MMGVHGYWGFDTYVGTVASAGTKVDGTIDWHTLSSASGRASDYRGRVQVIGARYNVVDA